jgi:ketosteroid isomerase-like protein
VLLRAGADPNDGQALYNRGWGPDPDEEWLELLFEFGLGTGDGGRWRRLLGDRQDSPGQMLEDLLMAAAGHGLTERVRRLLHRGVSPDGRGSAHPIYEGRSPAQEAALSGHRDVVSLLVEAGARWEPDPVDALVMEAMAGERDTVDVLLTADPGLREQALQRRPDQLVRAAEEGSRAAVSLQQRSPVSDRDGAGTAMRTVTAAFTAVSEGHFDELENLLAVDLDWRGAPDEDGSIPSCHGRAVALERMRIGWAARGEVGVTALVEEGDRVLARVRRTHTDRPEPPDRFVVAEVQDGQITRLCGYLTEEEARDALGE